MTASEHLRAILNRMYGDEPKVLAVAEQREMHPGWEGWVNIPGAMLRPTHVVIDVEGDIVGRGMSEDDAVADAINSAHKYLAERLDEYRRVVRAFRVARDDLDKLV